MKSFTSVATCVALTGLAVSTASASITIPTVTIGNPGNAPDPLTNFGSVNYVYNIGTTEVTNAQYAAFLNAKAATDTRGLYNTFMGTAVGGISRSGSAGSYTYSAIAGRENNPVNFVSYWDATRFANWLHNGQGNGDTETGAYTLTPGGISANTITRNAGWQWALPSQAPGQDEWYKAAYHQPASAGGDADDYWFFPTSSNTINTSQANFNSTGLRPVGSFAPNFYGTFDMGGNVAEWTEGADINVRNIRGGSAVSSQNALAADFEVYNFTTREDQFLGVRVVQVPTPGAAAMLGLGGLLAARRRRR
jgi:sulfatase modifying factor 1